MVVSVISNVATLAPCPEVFWIAVFGLVVEVGDGEYDAATGNGVRLSVPGATVGILWTAFAAIAGAVEHGAADFTPVFRVPRPVFDGHGADSAILCSVIGSLQSASD